MDFINQIVTSIVAGGAAVAFLWPILKGLISTWMDDRLKRELQGLVHIQNKEIERLRAELTKTFDRASKLNHREFEVLPDTWATVSGAFWAVHGFVHPFQEYPDVGAMTEAQKTEFLASTELQGWEKDKILHSTDQTREYIDVIYWHRFSRARRLVSEAGSCLAKSGIFIEDSLREQLDELLHRSNAALIEDETNKRSPPLRPQDRLRAAVNWMRTDGPKAIGQAETAIKRRLWNAS